MSKVIQIGKGTNDYNNIIDLTDRNKEIIYKEFWRDATVGLIEACAEQVIKDLIRGDKQNAEVWAKYMKKYIEGARTEFNQKEENAVEIAFEKRMIDLEMHIIQTRQIVGDQDAVNLSGVAAPHNDANDNEQIS